MDYFYSLTATSTVAIVAFPLAKVLKISLGNMAEKYGRTFTIKLGVHRALVVRNFGYNNSMIAVVSYGPFWRQVRKFATVVLLSNHWLDLITQRKVVRVKKILVDMKRRFKGVTLNMILRVILGKRISNLYEGSETLKWKKLMDDSFELGGKFVLSDALPFLRWLDIEHKEKRAENDVNNDEDFMGVMLSILRDAEKHDFDIINKATSLDTTSIILKWTLSLLPSNCDKLSKVQQELDVHIGKDRLLVTELDTKNLVYLQSIIKETLCLYPPIPLPLIHEAIEDCTVNGYHVSIGTWLIMNLHKIHHDPLIWTNPF
uniref:Cytochrome P450 n=1 Tax=Gossypium raimondii TaxID=29730 RepID=A0A0D2U498_GOSRA|nr:hypothetical protein B456_010G015100 [Gossypium raimondii]